MDDLLRIAAAIQVTTAKDPPCAVATVVNTRGSAFRRSGARLLIKRSGKVEGCISAGCLEKDVIAHCEKLPNGAKPFLLTYDGRNRDDLIFGLHLGCDGLIEILVEPIAGNSLYSTLGTAISSTSDLSAVTILETGPARKLPLGLAFVRQEHAAKWNTDLPVTVLDRLDLEAEQALMQKRSALLELDIDGTRIQALAEYVKAIPSLLIIGNGAEVVPLTEMTNILGWNYTLVDDRKGSIQTSTASHTALSCVELNGLSNWLQQSNFHAALVMTHDYERDKLILRSLLACDLAYVGIVGPRKRTDKLLAEMVLEGVNIADHHLSHLHSPAGLDIGAERPEEIALSILSEIQAALSGHRGGFLKDRLGPIHHTSDRQTANNGPEELRSSTIRSVSCHL